MSLQPSPSPLPLPLPLATQASSFADSCVGGSDGYNFLFAPETKAEGVVVSKGKKRSKAHKAPKTHFTHVKRSRNITPFDQTRRCAKVGLTHWNTNQKSTGAPQYVLVEPVISTCFFSGRLVWYHANFTARPKNDPAAEPELFFVEIKDLWDADEVTKVCVLGPNELGSHSCTACCPSILHPEGGFNVGHGRPYVLSENFPKPSLKYKGEFFFCKGRMYEGRPPAVLSDIRPKTMLVCEGEFVPKGKRSRSKSTVARKLT